MVRFVLLRTVQQCSVLGARQLEQQVARGSTIAFAIDLKPASHTVSIELGSGRTNRFEPVPASARQRHVSLSSTSRAARA
jgi:hypothetical protein